MFLKIVCGEWATEGYVADTLIECDRVTVEHRHVPDSRDLGNDKGFEWIPQYIPEDKIHQYLKISCHSDRREPIHVRYLMATDCYAYLLNEAGKTVNSWRAKNVPRVQDMSDARLLSKLIGLPNVHKDILKAIGARLYPSYRS